MIKEELLTYIYLANPWIRNPQASVFAEKNYISREQTSALLNPSWDNYISILTGPRQSGKTTLAKFVCQQLINAKRYSHVLYLSCDEYLVREWLVGSHVIRDIQKLLGNEKFILFIDEVQRLENPGLLLKSIFDLKLPIKLIATGSSQLEMKSKVQEYLTGRQFESLILPLSYIELAASHQLALHNTVIYGCYPRIVIENDKQLILQNLYQNYINKDIIEILKIKNADTIRQLLMLIAHSSGQLINYQQLATDSRVSTPTVQHYLSILENTYVISAVKPFVGNKRTEITSNPMYYYLDNGFRNQALNNFLPLENRTDVGLLTQSVVFQEIYKLKTQFYLDVEIKYWRTKGGAEVDFVLSKGADLQIPIEVKYKNHITNNVSRSYLSFVEAYQPNVGFVITQNFYGEKEIEGCTTYFYPLSAMAECCLKLLEIIR